MKQRRPLPSPAARRGQRGAERRGGSGTLWLLAAAFVWGAAATGFAIANHRAVQRLTEEVELRQTAHDDKVRALTRRLVGVASHQVLEEEGLSGRLADIITRQVDLESRQALLAAMAERTLADKVPGDRPVLDKPANERATPIPPPPPVEPALGERSRRRPEGRDGAPPAEGAPTARPGRSGGLRDDPGLSEARLTGLGTRDLFGRIEASLSRVEAGQLRMLTTLTAAGRGAVERIRAVLADLPLSVSPPVAAPAPSPASRDSFSAAVAQAEGAIADANRWRMTVDTLPLLAPIEGGAGLTSNFGLRSDPFTGVARMHAGMDFRSPVGTPVRAAASGRVVTAGQSGGYGNLVEIEHGRDVVTRYGHLSSIGVTVDQTVAAGAVIGLVGSTGRSTGPHLHYETRLAAGPVDPARFLGAGRILFAATATAGTGATASQADPFVDAPADAAD